MGFSTDAQYFYCYAFLLSFAMEVECLHFNLKRSVVFIILSEFGWILQYAVVRILGFESNIIEIFLFMFFLVPILLTIGLLTKKKKNFDNWHMRLKAWGYLRIIFFIVPVAAYFTKEFFDSEMKKLVLIIAQSAFSFLIYNLIYVFEKRKNNSQ